MPRSVAVLVLGDVGRSPRMQYHARSIAADHGAPVSLIGYRGEKCIDGVESNPLITKYLLKQWFRGAPRWLFLLWAPLKVALQICQLLFTLLWLIPRPQSILVQNPPSIPSLLVAWIACRVRGARLVIDWHNFGYTVLGLGLGKHHVLVRISYWYERFLAGRADAHLCVTAAMAAWLKANWGVTAQVLYDRPPEFFRQTTAGEAHELFTRLGSQFPPCHAPEGKVDEYTLFMQMKGGKAAWRDDRPALLISSTSWTPDEDFGILLKAVSKWDDENRGSGKRIVLIVTGKGPQRAYYEKKIASMGLTSVSIRTMWLEASDYPLLLGSSTMGVCLHTSTSGLDLPMKVVDMFGCGLPVCAINFACLSELVKDGINGMVFRTADDLAASITSMLKGFPKAATLDRLRKGTEAFQALRWSDNWTSKARALVVPS